MFFSFVFLCVATAKSQTTTWTGAAGAGNPYWDIATNWSNGVPPDSGTAVIAEFYSPVLRTGSVSLTSLQDQGNLSITGGSLFIYSASTIGGSFNMSGGELGGTGTTTITGTTGTSTWTAGTVGSNAPGVITFDGALGITGQGGKAIQGGTVTTAGTTIWGGNTAVNGNFISVNQVSSGGATLNNTGTWMDENTFATGMAQLYGGNAFNNLKTYDKTANSVTTMSLPFNNSGTVNVEKGTLSLASGGTSSGVFNESSGATLQLSGGTMTLTGATLTGSGTFQLAGGNASQSGTTTESGQLNIMSGALYVYGNWTAGSFNMSGGELGGTGTTTITGTTGTSTWTAGTVGSNAPGVITFDGALGITGQGGKAIQGGTVTTAGTTIWGGNTAVNGNFISVNQVSSGGATLNNTGTWMDENTFATGMAQLYGGNAFNNLKTYDKTANSVTTMSLPFNNSGTVNVEKGTLSLASGGTSSGVFNESSGATLQLSGGTMTLTGATLTGSGTFQLAGGNASQSGTTTESGQLNIMSGALYVYGNWTAGSFNMSGGELGGTGTTTITGTTGTSTWTAGTVGSNAPGVITFDGALGITGQGGKAIQGGTVTTAGTTIWGGNTAVNGNFISVNQVSSGGATLNNTGTWMDENTFATGMAQLYGGNAFNNLKTYDKTANSVTTMSLPFNNSGTVNVEKGTLSLASGGTSSGVFNESSGATLQLSGGTMTLTGATLTGSGTFQLAGGNASQSGTTTESGQLNMVGGALSVYGTWTAGSFNMSGGELGGTGTTTITGTTGTSTWTAGTVGSNAPGVITFDGALGITGQGGKAIQGGTVTTAGTTIWGGNTAVNGNFISVNQVSSGGATLNNTGTWMDENTFATGMAQLYGGNAFNNSGTYDKVGNTVTTFSLPFNNTGTVNVENGTLVFSDLANFSSNTLTGGTFKVTGILEFAGASIQTNASNITLSGKSAQILNASNGSSALASFATNSAAGSFTVSSGATFTTGGDFDNLGTLTAASGSTFAVGGNLKNFAGSTLTGGSYVVAGTLKFAGADIVTNSADITLSGSSSEILNSTTGTDALTKFAANSSAGTFSVIGGRTFTTSGNFTNAGTLSVGNGSSFATKELSNLSGTTLTGGVYDIAGVLNIAGASIVNNKADISLSGSSAEIVNSSNNANALAAFADNSSTGVFSLSGLSFTTAGSFTNAGTLSVGTGSTFTASSLTNFSGTTLSGGTYDLSGTLKFSGANIATNAANISLSGAGAQILNSSNSSDALAKLSSNSSTGAFSVSNGKAFTTTAGAFANAGILSIGAGSSFSLGGSSLLTQTAGKIVDDGKLSAGGGISLLGGSFFGTGSITGNLQSSSAITPGDSASSTGILTETGVYTQNSGGTLNIAIGGTVAGTQYDSLNATSAKLAGTLNIQLANGFVPVIGSTYKVVNFNSETGQFSTVKGLAINGSEHFVASYQGTDVLLTVASGAAPTTVLPPLIGPLVSNLAGDRIGLKGTDDGKFGLDAMIRGEAARDVAAPSMSHGMLANRSTNTSIANGAMPPHDGFNGDFSATMRGSRLNFASVSATRHAGTVGSRPAVAARAKLPGKSVNANFEFPLIKFLSVPHMTISTN